MNAAPHIDCRITVGSAVLQNPVIAASGCYNDGTEYAALTDVSKYGAIVLKSVTREPRLGNDMPRLATTPCGMLNAIGLQGPGIAHFLEHQAPKLRSARTAVIASVAGFSTAEYADVAACMDGLPNVVAIELDVSCPNVDREGECFAARPEATAEVVTAVKARVKLPVIAKLTADVGDIAAVAAAAEAAGADAVSLINAVRGMAIDVVQARPALANISGGLTGPAIRPIAVLAVWEASQRLKIPILGTGGIASGRDALEFMFAGATGVQIGTANFQDPEVHVKTLGALVEEAHRRQLSSLRSLVGIANPGFSGVRHQHWAPAAQAQGVLP